MHTIQDARRVLDVLTLSELIERNDLEEEDILLHLLNSGWVKWPEWLVEIEE